MGFFKGIISGVKAIFGAGENGTNNVMKAASGIGSFIDEQQFTEQERALYNKDLIPMFQQYMNSTVKENSQRSITRRMLALWVIRCWFIMLFMSIGAHVLGFDTQAAYIYKVATITELLYLVLGVGAFFFGAHIIRQTSLANPKA